MARFSGNIGYLMTVEKIEDGMKTGIWEETYIVKKYYGDVIRDISKWNNTNNLNDDISTNNSISIVADPFACNNFQHIKYVEWMGQKWKVQSIDVKYPRLLLSLGGVYNDKENAITSETN